MQIQINTGHRIEGTESLAAHVSGVVESVLERVSARITRVEVHLSDESGPGHGPDQRCMMEARLAGRHPTAVTHHAPTVDLAVDGAAAKLLSSIEHTLGRLEDHH